MEFQKDLQSKFTDAQLGHNAESPLEPLKPREKWSPFQPKPPGSLSDELQADENVQNLVDQVNINFIQTF